MPSTILIGLIWFYNLFTYICFDFKLKNFDIIKYTGIKFNLNKQNSYESTN